MSACCGGFPGLPGGVARDETTRLHKEPLPGKPQVGEPKEDSSAETPQSQVIQTSAASPNDSSTWSSIIARHATAGTAEENHEDSMGSIR